MAKHPLLRGVQWGVSSPADTPINETPDWSEDFIQQSDVARQINDRGEPHPNILTGFKKRVGAVYTQPSDLVFTQTYFLLGGAGPVSIVNPMDAGVACRVTITNLGDGTGGTGHGKILIAPNAEFLTAANAANTGRGQGMAFSIPPPAANAAPVPLTLQISTGLSAICIDNAITAEVCVLQEIYSPDAYTWDSWEPGSE